MGDAEGKKTTFGAFLAFESKPVTETKYQFRIHPTKPTWVTVDMTKIPANLKTNTNPTGIAWEDVEIDAGDKESATRLIGWSKAGGFKGVIYLSDRYMKTNKISLSPPLTPDGTPMGEAYEFMTIMYSPDSPVLAGFRFYGFHARITKKRDDGQVLVSIYDAGTSQDSLEEPAMTVWAKLDDPTVYELDHPSSISMCRSEGALFIERFQAKENRGLQLKFPGSVLLNGKDPAVLDKLEDFDIV